MNHWREVWQKRNADSKVLSAADPGAVLVELKRAAGFDITSEGLNEEALLQQYGMTKKNLSQGIHSSMELTSVYEVGCGSGANLFLFENDGLSCGGIDYSQGLIDIARKVLKTSDLVCDEAVNISGEAYDAVLSNSVFSYFQDEGYAERVLTKMLEKAKFSIGILDVMMLKRKMPLWHIESGR